MVIKITSMVDTIIQLVSPLLGTSAGGAEAAAAGAGAAAAGVAAAAGAAVAEEAGSAGFAAADSAGVAGVWAMTGTPVASRLRPSAREASSFFIWVISFLSVWIELVRSARLAPYRASLPVSPVRMRTTCSRL